MWSFTSSIPVVNVPHPSKHKAASVDSPVDDSKKPNNISNGNVSIAHCVLAGGIGGLLGDTVMHSLDTVKTRQQGAPTILRYRNMLHAYKTILIEEGIRKGLYGGYSAAMLGSFPSAAIFFGTYEYMKRKISNDWEINDTTTHLVSGFLGDFVSSFAYVPSEVLKTRLQLQGKYNNRFSDSGYNYRNLIDAIKVIIKEEGFLALFYGYKATLARDLPFSALQFAFYEKFRTTAFLLDKNKIDPESLSLSLEILTGAAAGGLAGIITTPFDVVKTRLQTQHSTDTQIIENHKFVNTKKPVVLKNSITKSIRAVYQYEGIIGLFSGVGPRFVWTSIQSSIMLLLYQTTLKSLRNYPT